MSRSATRRKLMVLVVAVAGAILTLCLYGRPALHSFKEHHAVQLAKKFATRQDFRSASLSAREALRLNATNLEACEVMAAMAEAAGAPQLLEWRQKIADLAPTAENKLKLAKASLLVQEAPWPVAAKTLSELSEAGKQLPLFHVLSAQLALKLNHQLEAESHFTEAARLEPANEDHQFNLAVLRLSSTNLLVSSISRATLERMACDSKRETAALRALVSDALFRTNVARAEALSERLVGGSRANLADHLQYLGILRLSSSPGFELALSNLQRETLTNAASMRLLSGWMNRYGMAAPALAWLTNCPADLQRQEAVRLATADCFMALGDWAGLEARIEPEKWGDLEPIRLALLSQCAFERHDQVASAAHWRLAVHHAGGKLSFLSQLLSLSEKWGRNQEREDVLWEIGERFPRERWSYQELSRLYYETGNTRGLNKVYSALCGCDSTDLVARNNFAATSLLLRVNLAKAHELARENYWQQPLDPVVVSTYAFSLHLQGRTKEGLAVVEKLTPEQRRDPAIAVYYALLLQVDGQVHKAAEYAGAMPPGHRLLPEERAILAEVKNAGARS